MDIHKRICHTRNKVCKFLHLHTVDWNKVLVLTRSKHQCILLHMYNSILHLQGYKFLHLDMAGRHKILALSDSKYHRIHYDKYNSILHPWEDHKILHFDIDDSNKFQIHSQVRSIWLDTCKCTVCTH